MKRFRLAERRILLGLSQERLAEALQVDRSTVARWERGECDPLPWHRTALAKALNLSMEELAQLLSSTPVTTNRVPETLPPSPPFTVSAHRNDTINTEEEDVQRRTFLKGFATAGMTAAAYGLEVLRHDLVAAAGGFSADVADWEAIAWDNGRTFAATPAPLLLDDLALDLFVARERLHSLRDDGPRAGLQRVIAQLAVFMAHTLGNLGYARASFRWWSVAEYCAANAADNELRMWVAGRRIIGGLYEHRSPESLLALADQAMTITSKPGMGTGSVLVGRAQVLAAIGLESQAIEAMAEPVKIGETGIGHIVCMTAGGWLIQAAPGMRGGVGLRRNRLGLAA